MLTRVKTKYVKRKLTIRLTAEMAARLDRIVHNAIVAGDEAVVEQAIAQYLARAIGIEEALNEKRNA